MRKIKNIQFAVLGLIFLFASFSEADAQKSSNDVLKLVRDKYNDMINFQADYLHIQNWTYSEIIDTVRGEITLLKPDYYILESSDIRFMTDGKAVWDYNLLENKANIDHYEKTDDTFLLKDYLFEFPKRFITVDFRQEERGCVPGFVIEMEPKKPEEEMMQNLEVWVDALVWAVKQVKYVDIDETVTHYMLNNYRVDVEFTQVDFDEKKPGTGVKIRDLRKKG